MNDTIKDLPKREEFTEGQWWLQELDAMVASGTPDQRRAVAVVRNLMRQYSALSARVEAPVEAFVVRHYIGDDRPSIKGNGFDGLEIGGDREEAENFISFVNSRMLAAPKP